MFELTHLFLFNTFHVQNILLIGFFVVWYALDCSYVDFNACQCTITNKEV